MKIVKKLGKTLLVTFGAIFVLALVVPLLIPIKGETGLNENQDLRNENGYFIEIPYNDAENIEIYYEYTASSTESDKNFILIHGSMYNVQTWNLVVEELSKYGNIYAYDQVPYGLSEKIQPEEIDMSNPYTIDAAVNQLEMLMEELNIDSATLVGSSYGAVIAAELAVKNPESVEAMIFVDPAILVSESVPAWIMNTPQMDHLGPFVAKTMLNSDAFYEAIYYDKTVLDESRMAANKQITQINNYNLAYWEYLKAWMISPSDVQNELSEIEVEVLVITGEFDTVVPPEDSETISNLLPNSTYIVIENCGHMPHEEKPEEFLEIVDEWISSGNN